MITRIIHLIYNSWKRYPIGDPKYWKKKKKDETKGSEYRHTRIYTYNTSSTKVSRIEAQCSFHGLRIGGRRSRVEYLCINIYHPFFFCKPQFSHHPSDFQASPRSRKWKKRRHTISTTNGIAALTATNDVGLISKQRLVVEILALFPRRMGVLETPIHPCYIDLHPCAISGVESTNDTVVTFVWQRGLWSRPRISRG